MNNTIIDAENISIAYKLYNNPQDRLKEALSPFGKKYHKLFYALKDINFKVSKGEVVGIVGKNGAGKSTLLKIIAGILQPSSGGLKVNGKVFALLELGSGFNPEFTGLENIYFYGMIHDIDKDSIHEVAEEIIDFAEIGEFINQPLKTYSTGMKARLAFAASTVMEPEVLIIDEVLSVGDAYFMKKSFSKMEQLIKGGTTVLFVSHAQQSIIQVCSRAIMLRNGELILDGTPGNVVKVYLKSMDSKKDPAAEDLRNDLKKLENKDGRIHPEESPSSSGPGDTKKTVSPDDDTPSEPFRINAASLVTNNADITLLKLWILDENGNKANTIHHGRRYDLTLDFQFNEDADSIVFPIGIRTPKGLEISAIRYPDDNSYIPHVGAGSTVRIRWNFEASILPGNYFITVGITSFAAGNKKVLFRMDDALMFKVIDTSSKIHWGLVSLKQKALHFQIEPSIRNN